MPTQCSGRDVISQALLTTGRGCGGCQSHWSPAPRLCLSACCRNMQGAFFRDVKLGCVGSDDGFGNNGALDICSDLEVQVAGFAGSGIIK